MKYKGKGLTLTIGTQDVDVEATSISLENAENNDAQTFADVAAGGSVDWSFKITATSDYADSSFWGFLWANSGQDVTYTFKPYGNATASATQPWFTGTVTVPAKPKIGGDAGSVFTFDVTMDCTGEPTKVTA